MAGACPDPLSPACPHTASESVTVQDMIQTQVRKKKVKYIAHPCSVLILTVVDKSQLLFPLPLFQL